MKLDAGHISEFTPGGVTGRCGETALEVAESASADRRATIAGMEAITADMQAHGQADPNGASTLWGLARAAERGGFHIATEWDYAEPFPHDWHALLLAEADNRPVVLQLANAQALTDAETGASDERGVHYHFICVLGKQPHGFICADGDNPEVGSRYQVYSYATLAAAVPCGALVLDLQPNAGEVPMAWSTHGSGAIDSKGHTANAGLAALLIGNHLPDGTCNETPYNGVGDVFVALTDGQIATWTHSEGARLDRGGLVVNALLGVVASLKQQLASAQGTPALTPKQQFGLKILDALFQYEKMS